MLTALTYYGAICAGLSVITGILHATGLDESKYGSMFCKVSNDVIGLYKQIKTPPAP